MKNEEAVNEGLRGRQRRTKRWSTKNKEAFNEELRGGQRRTKRGSAKDKEGINEGLRGCQRRTKRPTTKSLGLRYEEHRGWQGPTLSGAASGHVKGGVRSALLSPGISPTGLMRRRGDAETRKSRLCHPERRAVGRAAVKDQPPPQRARASSDESRATRLPFSPESTDRAPGSRRTSRQGQAQSHQAIRRSPARTRPC
jgi:hypothetical protein